MGGSFDSTESTRSEEPAPPPTGDWLLPRAVLKSLTILALAVAFLMGLLDGFAADYLRPGRDRSRSD